MFSRAALIVLVVGVVEFVTFSFFIYQFGFGWVALGAVISSVTGVALVKKQWASVFGNGLDGFMRLAESGCGGSPIQCLVTSRVTRFAPMRGSTGFGPFDSSNGRYSHRRDVVNTDLVTEDRPDKVRSELD